MGLPLKLRALDRFAVIVVLAAIYVAAAKLGLSLAPSTAPQVSLIWPATGLALASLLLFSKRVWPGITLGAFLANVTADEPLGTALGIAVGNTLEAVVAAWVLRRVVHFQPSLERPRDVLGLMGLAATLGPAVGATIGAASLCAGQVHAWGDYGTLWRDWWLGDAMGAILLTPALLVWAWVSHSLWRPARTAEALIILVCASVVDCLVFAETPEWLSAAHPLEYMVFPFLVWSALRLGQRWTSLMAVEAAAIAIVGTIAGAGPFANEPEHDDLMLLQLFLGVMSGTALLLGAAIAERNLGAIRRDTIFAVTQILAETASVNVTGRRILRTIGESLGWDMGALWLVDESGEELCCAESWHRPVTELLDFDALTRQFMPKKGIGLPGRVWESGQPAWIQDVTMDTNFPRAEAAAAVRLHGAFGFPILLGPRVLGVMEFFSQEIRQPDPSLLQLFATVGGQIGLFMERNRAQKELQRRADQLADADRRKDEFLAMLAHELRNPLAPLRNAVQILRIKGRQSAEVERVREMMDRQVEHLVRLVDDLLEVSRITRGKIELRKEPVDLAQIIQSGVETSRSLIEAARHRLTLHLPSGTVVIHADPVRLTQVVGNLLNNAAKYTDPGGRIDVTLESEQTTAIIRVRDTGVGIPTEKLADVFGMFTQLNQNPDRAQGGLGIGLSLVRSLVEMHGGSVHAFSEGTGKGSEFTVRLPLATSVRDALPARPPVARGAIVRPTPRRILVVDDNEDAAETVGMLLEMKGDLVKIANDGVSALELADSFKPSVVLMDISMPGMDGYEVARRMRLHPRVKRAILIALTGRGQEIDRQHSLQAGFDYHLIKPVDPRKLDELLASLPGDGNGESREKSPSGETSGAH